jgi:hypothetical protein
MIRRRDRRSAASAALRGPHGPRLRPCSRAPAARCCFDEEIDDFAHRSLAYRGFGERKVVLNDVPVAAAVALLQHVPGVGEVVDDRVRAALSDIEQRDVARAYVRIARDLRERPP